VKAGLVIGLGGTGVLALQHIKAQLVGGEQRALPNNVKLLAFDTVQDQERTDASESTLKGVSLDPGEYFWIGGDVYDYAVEVDNGMHPHVGSWFQAETYLKTLPRASFTLQRGAGQLRQFGRLAIFKDVAAPALSNIRRLVNDAITAIRNTGFIVNLDVFLISSVAGGTGAGMFVDIAYLVRMLAQEEQSGQKITLRGFLVLPEAFSAIPGGIDNPMRARSYAAMRENRRFMVDFAWKTGYPMHYQEKGIGGVWSSEMKTKLFDSLYHIDGQRANNPLTQVLPKFGVTATIGDSIVAMLDDPEDKYGQHNQNVITASGRKEVAGLTSFDSAIGTYTMVLPMRQVVESMSYRLLLRTLDAVDAPVAKDEDGYPTAVAPDHNLEAGEGARGRNAAAAFLQASEIQALAGTEKVLMTQLPPEIFRIASRYARNNPGLIQELVARDPKEWENALDPTGETADVQTLRQQVQQELGSSLIAAVQPKLQGEKPQDSVVRIPPAVEQFKAEHLGREDPRTGQRTGGKYRKALADYAVKHVDRFRDAVRLEILNILNGSSQKDARESKTGKLGYLCDMLNGLDELFGRFILALDDAHQMREKLGMRTSVTGNVQAARQSMEAKPGGIFGWGGAQKAYLDAEAALIAQIKTDILEESVRGTVQQMQDHVRALKTSADSWVSTLAVGFDGLYAQTLRGQKKLGDILQEQSDVKVRCVLPEIPKPLNVARNKEEEAKEIQKAEERKKYYDDLYHKYAEDLKDGLAAILGDLTWGYERRRSGGRDVYGLTLTLGGVQADVEAGNEGPNLNIFLNRCRQVFADAWQQESVLKYLMRRFPRPDALAKELVENGGPLLSITGGQPTPANYFHISFGKDQVERAYLEGVQAALVKLSGATGVLNEVINSADRFACRLVYTLDLVPLDQVQSYRGSRQSYLNYAQRIENAEARGVLGRETLHLFPAEVNAARFEARVPTELGLPPRELHNDVVLQLENMDRFRVFVRAWVYDVICRERDSVKAGYQHYFALKLPAENLSQRIFGERRELKVYLSKPDLNKANLLEALETFQYIGKDVRLAIEEPIPYERMERAVAEAKSLLVEARLGITRNTTEGGSVVEAVTKPLTNLEPMVQQYVARLPQHEQIRAWKLLAERAILQERQAEVKKDFTDTNNTSTLRDIATVFWLALEDEIKSVQEAIASLLEASRGVA
jgi:hypothetical protein